MANCYSSGSTYGVSRGINCSNMSTNAAYYQNFPFYGGPCGCVNGNCPGNDNENNNCTCNNGCTCNSGCGCNNNCGCSNGNTENCCRCCNPCNGPSVSLITSIGAVTTTAGSTVPIMLSAAATDPSVPLSTANAISVMGNNIIFNCAGTYLIFLNVVLPDTVTYDGTVGLTLNGSLLSTATQNIDVTTEAYNGTSQALVRVTEGSMMTVNTSAALTATPEGTSNIVTITVIRVA